MVSLLLRSVSVARCFHEKVSGRFGFDVYTCAPSVTVRLPWHSLALSA